MKRSMKKYLMLLMAILSIMTMGVFAASAEGTTAECDHKLYNSYLGNVHDATCTSDGYTDIMCGNCNQAIGRTDVVPAKGHKFTWEYVVSGDHYEYKGSCEKCFYSQSQTDDDGNKIVYYAITLKNPAAAKSYITNVTYTKVVNERQGMKGAIDFKTVYVKKGDAISTALPSVPNVACEKDTQYGKYDFIGWFSETEEPVIIDSGEDGDKTLASLEQSGVVNYLNTPADGEDAVVINGNMVLYAGFRGVDVSYTVSFYNYDGRSLAKSTGVHHGKATVYNLATPTKDYDMVNRYFFSHWGYNGNRVNLNAIYDDISVVANFTAVPRQYNVEYYFDAACTKPVINMNVVVKDSGIKYGERASNGLEVPESIIKKGKDDAYIYEWTGKWVLATRQDYVVDLESFTVPNLTPDAIDGSTCVRIIPQYLKKARIYDLEVKIVYPNDNNYHPEKVSIQILYANGKTADVRDIVMDGDTYSYIAEVNYSEYYTISVSAVGYSGEVISHFFSNSDNPDYSSPSGAIVMMEKVEAYSCGCICHTFMKPVWIRVLRILHTLFGIEYVCCSDMYANIGSSLNYGPGK